MNIERAIEDAIAPHRAANEFDVLSSAILEMIQANTAMLKRIETLEKRSHHHEQAHKEEAR